MIHLAVLVLMSSSIVPAEQAAGPGVKAIGVYPLLLPGLQAVPAGRPRVHLWCHGVKLLGVMVPDESQQKAATSGQGRLLAPALLLRNGRCETDGGGVSFGFLVPMKAWIFDPRCALVQAHHVAAAPFQGTVSDRQLKGVLVQVDVSHPGFAFPEAKVEVEALGEDQGSFADEKSWLEDVAQTFSVVRSEPDRQGARAYLRRGRPCRSIGVRCCRQVVPVLIRQDGFSKPPSDPFRIPVGRMAV
jgi:hypothetical protein